jgi:hypothetical protein
VGDVCESGYSVVSFAQLFSVEDWERLATQADEFVRETEAKIDELRQGNGESLVRKYDCSRENLLALGDPWMRLCLSPMLLGIANEVLQMWSKLEYVDLWYSIPVASAERKTSQPWHRDFEDSHLLKLFLYLREVDQRSGPFEFVAGSQIGGPLAHIEPWQPTGIAVSERGAALKELDQRVSSEVPKNRIRTFTGPAGTMVFCDTTGLHRDGSAQDQARVLATAAYTSPASLAALTRRNFTLAGGDARSLEPAAGFALQ